MQQILGFLKPGNETCKTGLVLRVLRIPLHPGLETSQSWSKISLLLDFANVQKEAETALWTSYPFWLVLQGTRDIYAEFPDSP